MLLSCLILVICYCVAVACTVHLGSACTFANLSQNFVLVLNFNTLQTLGVLPLYLLPVSPPSPFSLPAPLIQIGGLGSAVSSAPHGSGWSLAAKHILVHFEVKVKHFRVLMSCIVCCTLPLTAIDLFYDDTDHTINYADENSVCTCQVV